MAVRLLNSRHIINKFQGAVRLFSTKQDRIVVTDDGTTFVAWHPRQDFPYDCTRAIPVKVIEESNTVLKSVMGPELKQMFKKKTPEVARQELMNITHTTKHRWFPRARDKKAKKTDPDREYL
ncbi:mitochondrial ribosomal protein L42 [Carabus blaptoides fortunei]